MISIVRLSGICAYNGRFEIFYPSSEPEANQNRLFLGYLAPDTADFTSFLL